MNDVGMAMDGLQRVRQNSFAVFNPATTAPIGSVANSIIDGLNCTVSAAKSAYSACTALPNSDHKAAIDKLAIPVETNQQELAQLITQHPGKPVADLGGTICSSNTEAAKSLAMRLKCGSVWINKHGAIQPNAPFAGMKKSEIGVKFGEEGLFENTDTQAIFAECFDNFCLGFNLLTGMQKAIKQPLKITTLDY